MRRAICQVLFAGAFAATGMAAETAPAPTPPSRDDDHAALYFASPEDAVLVTGKLIAAQNWATLARYYDLSLTPQVKREQLRDGSFFVDASASPTGPQAIERWRQPFPPGAKFLEAKAVGDSNKLPCVWTLTTSLAIDQGGGPMQRMMRETRLLHTAQGFQFLPPAPTESARPPAPPVTDEAWQARGADPTLLYRPALRARAADEVPVGRSSNIPALVKAIERLKPLAAAHPGKTQPGSPPLGEPAEVYLPSDDELLLSLAGDRIWRSLQIAPVGTLDNVRQSNPDWKDVATEYPHIEIVRVNVAGSGPHVYALAPVPRRLNFGEAKR